MSAQTSPGGGVLLFLGAGASAPFGVPTMRGMVDGFKAHIRNRPQPEKDFFYAIRDELEAIYGNRNDIEKILSVIMDLAESKPTRKAFLSLGSAAYLRFQRLRNLGGPRLTKLLESLDRSLKESQETANTLRQLLLDYIVSSCNGADLERAATTYEDLLHRLSGSLRDEAGDIITAEKLYSPRSKRPARLVTVATTNYDLCFEAYCKKYSVPWSNGFEFNELEREQVYDDSSEQSDDRIRILKLHGSIDWWRTSDNRVTVRPGARAGDPFSGTESLTRPEIHYPTSIKDLFGVPYTHFYSRFAAALDASSLWIFIGYRFGDPSVVQLMQQTVKPGTRIIILLSKVEDLHEVMSGMRMNKNVTGVDGRFPEETCLKEVMAACDQPLLG